MMSTRAFPRPPVLAMAAVALGAVACGEVTPPPDPSPLGTGLGPFDPRLTLDSTLVVDTAYVAADVVHELIGAVVVGETIVKNGISIGTLLPPGGPTGPTGGTGATDPETPGPGTGPGTDLSEGPGGAGGPDASTPAADVPAPPPVDGPLRRIVCLAKVWRDPETGEIIAYEILYCWTEGGDDLGPGSGGGGTPPDPPPPEAKFSLECTSPLRGSRGTCTVSTSDTTVNLSSYSYAWSAGRNTHNGGPVWGGTATDTRTVSVTVSREGLPDERLTASSIVTSRSWTWPRGTDLGRTYSIPYRCFVDAMGLTRGRIPDATRCATDRFFDYESGFDVAEGSGPWGGSWYMSSPKQPDSVAGAEYGVHPRLSATGPEYPTSTLPDEIRQVSPCAISATVYAVNLCSAAAPDTLNGWPYFFSLINETTSHEQKHVDAVILESNFHQVWEKWEGIVSTSEAGVSSVAADVGTPVDGKLLRATLAVDDHSAPKSFIVWWWYGTVWDKARITTGRHGPR